MYSFRQKNITAFVEAIFEGRGNHNIKQRNYTVCLMVISPKGQNKITVTVDLMGKGTFGK